MRIQVEQEYQNDILNNRKSQDGIYIYKYFRKIKSINR